MPDFYFQGYPGDTVFLLVPQTLEAQQWIDDHLQEDYTRWGPGVVVEHNYVTEITRAIWNDGFEVEFPPDDI